MVVRLVTACFLLFFFVVVSHIDSDIEKRRSDCHLTQVTSAGLTAAEGALCAACHCLSSNLPIYIEKYWHKQTIYLAIYLQFGPECFPLRNRLDHHRYLPAWPAAIEPPSPCHSHSHNRIRCHQLCGSVLLTICRTDAPQPGCPMAIAKRGCWQLNFVYVVWWRLLRLR